MQKYDIFASIAGKLKFVKTIKAKSAKAALSSQKNKPNLVASVHCTQWIKELPEDHSFDGLLA